MLTTPTFFHLDVCCKLGYPDTALAKLRVIQKIDPTVTFQRVRIFVADTQDPQYHAHRAITLYDSIKTVEALQIMSQRKDTYFVIPGVHVLYRDYLALRETRDPSRRYSIAVGAVFEPRNPGVSREEYEREELEGMMDLTDWSTLFSQTFK